MWGEQRDTKCRAQPPSISLSSARPRRAAKELASLLLSPPPTPGLPTRVTCHPWLFFFFFFFLNFPSGNQTWTSGVGKPQNSTSFINFSLHMSFGCGSQVVAWGSPRCPAPARRPNHIDSFVWEHSPAGLENLPLPKSIQRFKTIYWRVLQLAFKPLIKDNTQEKLTPVALLGTV